MRFAYLQLPISLIVAAGLFVWSYLGWLQWLSIYSNVPDLYLSQSAQWAETTMWGWQVILGVIILTASGIVAIFAWVDS